MKRTLKISLFVLVILFITHFVVMFLFLRTPLTTPAKLVGDRALLAIMDYDLRSKDCSLFCFINESWKITLAYFKKGPGFYDYAGILRDKTKSLEIRNHILYLVYLDVYGRKYPIENDQELYKEILNIATDKSENTEMRLKSFDILKLVEYNDQKIKEVAKEIISDESNGDHSLKVVAAKLMVKTSEEDIDALFELLKNSDSYVNDNAFDALIKKYPRETYQRIEEIVEIAKNKKYKPAARTGALLLLSYLHQIFGIKDQTVINSLKELLNDEHGGVREMAADVLGEITGGKYEVIPATEAEEEEIFW